MEEHHKTNLSRLRLFAFLEGASLVLLIFVAVPLKYWLNLPRMVQILGPLHGALFLFFVLNTMSVAIEQRWKFWTTTWKVLLACLIPFGTFYIDYKILRRIAVQHDKSR
jgi:integral membrane protein